MDDLMTHLGRTYYVGWLSAAELHGAAHQRPQVTQVAVDHSVADRQVGRVRLRFHTRAGLSALPRLQHTVATGQVWVSSPELTAVDLVERPDSGGGTSNVATVLAELAADPGLAGHALATTAATCPAAIARRLGYLLELVGAPVDLDPLRALVASRPLSGRAVLTARGPRRGIVDDRWGLIVNSEVEADL